MPFKQHPTDPTKVVYVKRDDMQSPTLIDVCCSDCGKKITVDSIHTCSPQTLTALEVMEQTHRNISEAHRRKKTNTLTDDEIRQVIDDHWEKTSNVNLFDFARTILKIASEK